MRMTADDNDRAGAASAGCHGFTVVSSDGPCGFVETPLFPPDCKDPDFLVVRMSGPRSPRFRILPTSLVDVIDVSSETVVVAASRRELRRLPERLPLLG